MQQTLHSIITQYQQSVALSLLLCNEPVWQCLYVLRHLVSFKVKWRRTQDHVVFTQEMCQACNANAGIHTFDFVQVAHFYGVARSLVWGLQK